jgi:hypothetical protein
MTFDFVKKPPGGGARIPVNPRKRRVAAPGGHALGARACSRRSGFSPTTPRNLERRVR